VCENHCFPLRVGGLTITSTRCVAGIGTVHIVTENFAKPL
jgi:hypothetical protein